MGKLVKGVLIFFAAVVILIIAAVIIIPLVVDVNDYKPEIAAAVKDKTGRTLTIDGDLDLSVFPWLGVSTGQIALSNAPGFAEKPFAVIGESEIKVKLLPLLSKEVDISTVVLKGLELHLAKNKEGVSNWDDLAKPADAQPATEQAESAPEDSSTDASSPALAALAIGGLVIENSQISWDDQQAAQHAVVKDVNLQLGAVAFNEPIAIKLSFAVDSEKPAVNEQLSLSTTLVIDETLQQIQLTQLNIDSATKGEILSGGEVNLSFLSDVAIDLQQQKIQLTQLKVETTAKGGVVPESEVVAHLQSNISADLALQQVQLTQFKLESTTTGKVVPGGLLEAQLLSDIALDLKQQTAALKGLQLKTNVLDLSGDINVTQLNTDLHYAGPIRIAQFNPKAVLAQLQMDVPETADPQVLKQLAINFKLQGSADSAALENLQLTLDDTQIKGYARVRQFAKPAIAFDLAIDDIDVDRYSAPKKASEAAAASVATPATATAAATTLIPMETIRALDVNGKLSIGKLKAAQLKMAGVNVSVQAKQGMVKTKQSIKQLYKGHYQGQISLNAQPKTPLISLNEKITNVQIEPLLKDLQPKEEARLRGAVNVAAKLNTAGNTLEAIKSTLGGHVSFSLVKGAIKGINIQKMIDVGKLVVKNKEMKLHYADEQTVFSIIKGTAKIKKGLINNPDFLAESSKVEVKGGGTANLVNEALNYKVVAKVKQSPGKAAGNIKGRPVAINLGGTFTQPTYTLDVMSMLTEREQQKIDKVIGKGQKEIDKHLGEGAGKAVNNLLKGFF